MVKKSSEEAREKKKGMIIQLFEMFSEFDQIAFAQFSNVGSNQIQKIRKILGAKNSHLFIGKNVTKFLLDFN